MSVDLTSGATDGVIRVGETVHRPRGQWSDAVEALLLHLQKVGFRFSPRFLGHDAEGKQILSYIDGEVGEAFGVPGSPVHLDHRLELLLESYGFEDVEGVLEMISLRIRQIRDQAALLAQGTDRNARRIREAKRVESYDESLEYFRQQFGRKRT